MGLLKAINVGYVAGNWTLRLYEDSVSQSIDGNYSNVVLRLTLAADKTTWVSFDSRDAWIGGTHFTPAYRHDNPEHTLGTTTLKVNHNPDGTGSYNIAFGISTSYVLNGSSTAGRTLPTIPRASSFTTSGNMIGSAINVNISRASNAFKHKVTLKFGSKSDVVQNVDTACTFTPPEEYAKEIPNSTSGIATFTVETYNGTTLVGSKSSTITMNLPDSIVPSFDTLSTIRVDNGEPDGWNLYIQGVSKVLVAINGAKGVYESTIKSYKITGGGYSADADKLNTGVLNASGKITFTGTITDSRGRTASKTIDITVHENGKPSLSLKAERCDPKGNVSNNGTYIKITPTYSWASVGGKNHIASMIFKIEGTSYQITTLESGESIALGENMISVSKAYTVTGVVTDALGNSSGIISVTVPTSSVPFMARDDLKGVAFGKYSEREGIDSAWDFYAKGIWNAPAIYKKKSGENTGIQIVLEEV